MARGRAYLRWAARRYRGEEHIGVGIAIAIMGAMLFLFRAALLDRVPIVAWLPLFIAGTAIILAGILYYEQRPSPAARLALLPRPAGAGYQVLFFMLVSAGIFSFMVKTEDFVSTAILFAALRGIMSLINAALSRLASEAVFGAALVAIAVAAFGLPDLAFFGFPDLLRVGFLFLTAGLVEIAVGIVQRVVLAEDQP